MEHLLNAKLIDLVDNEGQETFSNEPIDWYYLAGLMQSDGSLTFQWKGQRKNEFYPRIFITFGQNRFRFAEHVIVPFLRNQGIAARLEPNTLEKCQRVGPTKVEVLKNRKGSLKSSSFLKVTFSKGKSSLTKGLNVVIEYKKHCNTFIKKVEDTFEKYEEIPFVEAKLRDYLIFKNSLKLQQEKVALGRSLLSRNRNVNIARIKEIDFKFIYLKSIYARRDVTGRARDAEFWLRRLGYSESSTDVERIGKQFYQEIYQEALTQTNKFVNLVEREAESGQNPDLKSFFTGLMEGDGTFFYGLHTHVNEPENTTRRRRVLDFNPEIHLTNKNEEFPVDFVWPPAKRRPHEVQTPSSDGAARLRADQGLFRMLKNWFDANNTPSSVGQNRNALRLHFKSVKTIKKANERLFSLRLKRKEFRRQQTVRLAELMETNQFYNSEIEMKNYVALRYKEEFSTISQQPSRPIDYYNSLVEEIIRGSHPTTPNDTQ